MGKISAENYYNYDKILSYNAMLNFLNGERGVRQNFWGKRSCNP